MTIVEFLAARLNDPIGQGDSTLECYGAGEYYVCGEWSEWHERTVAAQRAIIDLHRYASDGKWIDCSECGEIGVDRTEHGTPPPACQHLKILASVYSSHPDYDESWRP